MKPREDNGGLVAVRAPQGKEKLQRGSSFRSTSSSRSRRSRKDKKDSDKSKNDNAEAEAQERRDRLELLRFQYHDSSFRNDSSDEDEDEEDDDVSLDGSVASVSSWISNKGRKLFRGRSKSKKGNGSSSTLSNLSRDSSGGSRSSTTHGVLGRMLSFRSGAGNTSNLEDEEKQEMKVEEDLPESESSLLSGDDFLNASFTLRANNSSISLLGGFDLDDEDEEDEEEPQDVSVSQSGKKVRGLGGKRTDQGSRQKKTRENSQRMSAEQYKLSKKMGGSTSIDTSQAGSTSPRTRRTNSNEDSRSSRHDRPAPRRRPRQYRIGDSSQSRHRRTSRSVDSHESGPLRAEPPLRRTATADIPSSSTSISTARPAIYRNASFSRRRPNTSRFVMDDSSRVRARHNSDESPIHQLCSLLLDESSHKHNRQGGQETSPPPRKTKRCDSTVSGDETSITKGRRSVGRNKMPPRLHTR